MSNWRIFQGTGIPHDGIKNLPSPPRWRQFNGEISPAYEQEPGDSELGRRTIFQTSQAKTEIDLVNAALLLRRPLLITGPPGTGKSSLAHSVAYELKLGEVLQWPITSRSNLQDALYRYDAIGRLQEANLHRDSTTPPDIGRYIRLGPLGTALLPRSDPRVLLIDEIDKSDIDLPNDLLHIFEEGTFEIPELARLSEVQEKVEILPHDSQTRIPIWRGMITCRAFPIIFMTSNDERELPAPFLRRCIRLEIKPPDPDTLEKIVLAHFAQNLDEKTDQLPAYLAELRDRFVDKRSSGQLATDQLLNAIHLAIVMTQQGKEIGTKQAELDQLLPHVWRYLDMMSGI